jgi:hypothetical protein
MGIDPVSLRCYEVGEDRWKGVEFHITEILHRSVGRPVLFSGRDTDDVALSPLYPFCLSRLSQQRSALRFPSGSVTISENKNTAAYPS